MNFGGLFMALFGELEWYFMYPKRTKNFSLPTGS